MSLEKYRTLFLILLCIAILGFSKIEAKVRSNLPLFGRVIVVDAGHGGRDPGAMVGTTLEKDINLELAKILQDYLMQKGAIVYMTREVDEDLSSRWDPSKKRGDLYRRIIMFRKQDAEMYLSIHMNYHSDSSMRGAEVLYNKINPDNERLGTILMNHFKEELKTQRVLKQTDLYMYRNTTVPGVLIECGFISNGAERKLLKQEEYQKRLASIITESVIEYFN